MQSSSGQLKLFCYGNQMQSRILAIHNTDELYKIQIIMSSQGFKHDWWTSSFVAPNNMSMHCHAYWKYTGGVWNSDASIFHRHSCSLYDIGACRAPGKTWLCRIWCAIVKSVFCHCTVRYTYVCARICYMLVTTCLCARSSWYEYARFEITWAMPGYAQACRRPCSMVSTLEELHCS